MENQINYYQNKLNYEMDSFDLFNALEKKENVIPLDTRRSSIYKKEHIPGAINLHHRDMDENSTKNLDRSKTYVCYCNGIGCDGSTRGALNMTKLGFKVKELIGGLEWWKYDGYSTEGTEKTDGSENNCAC
jgi:rhodanese-related sulfurtransferase